MTDFLASCGCTFSTAMGQKAPVRCTAHGNRFVRASAMRSVVSSTPQKPRRRKGRSGPKRDWTLAITKREEENDLCRVCAATGTQCAHILGRKYDQPISPGARTLLVLPDRIVPLCGELTGHGCHERYDAHELDLLPYLTASEQAQAVLDAGSMGLALKRISPMLELAA